MDIRTKLVFTLVVVALGSMFVLSLAMYAIAEPALRDSRLDLLEALAESKRDDMDQVFAGWVDRVRLVASRTQLRISLQEHNRTGNPETVGRIHRILTDAVDAVDVIEALAVFDVEHHLVTSAGREMDMAGQEDLPQMTSVAEGIGYRGISPTGEGDLRVGFVARLSLEGEPVGDLHVRLNAQPLLDLAEAAPERLGDAQMLQRLSRIVHRTMNATEQLVDLGGVALSGVVLVDANTIAREVLGVPITNTTMLNFYSRPWLEVGKNVITVMIPQAPKSAANQLRRPTWRTSSRTAIPSANTRFLAAKRSATE